MPSTVRFTKQASRVVELLLQGKSNKQIATQLGIQVRTAEFHLKNIYSKLSVASRTEAVLKLAGESPQESTVVKTDKMAKNGRYPVLGLVPNMPIFLYVLVAAALVLAALGLWGVSSGVLKFPAVVTNTGATQLMATSTTLPAPTRTSTLTATAAPTASIT